MRITIPALDEAAMTAAHHRQDTRVKPRGALGELETLSIRLAGMTGHPDWMPTRRAAILFAADHGITAHNLSTVPQSVTAYMVKQFLKGQAAVNVLARQMNTRLTVVDAGVNATLDLSTSEAARFVSAKIGAGTADFSSGAAMSEAQASAALELGARIAREEIERGTDILVLGEMGIGNTTSASAIIAAITGADVASVTGRGTGIDQSALNRKVARIIAALEHHAPVQEQTLAKLGGFEIGAMAGAMLYAASQRVPILLDGLITTAAALIAHQHNPAVTHYLVPAHRSDEGGHLVALNQLGLEPLLALNLRLGEGSGALLALPLVEAAMRTLNEMGTLDVG